MLKVGLILGALALALAEDYPCPKNFPSTCGCNYQSLGGDVNRGSRNILCTKLDQILFEDVVLKLSGTDLYSLTFTNCSFTELKDNVFENLSIKVLDIIETPVEKIGADAFAGIKRLQSIRIDGCKLKNVPHLKHVSPPILFLNLNNNEITELYRNKFSDLNNLIELQINNNNIKSIEDGAFHGMPDLQRVFLTRNNISEIGNWFDENNEIRNLDLRGNNLDKIPENIVNSLKTFELENVNMDNNDIQSIEDGAFSLMNKLNSVNLRGNNITKIGNWFDFENVVVFLDLSDNNIEVIPENFVSSLRNLDFLYLKENNIKTITKTSLAAMIFRPYTYLDIRNNKIVCDKRHCWLYNYVENADNAKIKGDCEEIDGSSRIPFNSVITHGPKKSVNC